MFYITFHGGSGGCIKKKDPAITTIMRYNDDGTGGTPFAPDIPGGTDVGLRDIQYLSDGNFYLVNSYKTSSQVWQITPGNSPTGKVVFSPARVPAIDHPFALAFDSSMDVCFLTNQDTNVVVRVFGPKNPQAGQPLPVNPTYGTGFLAGTFVGSQNPLVPEGYDGPAPPVVSSAQGGLTTSPPTGAPSNSVRGVALIGQTLYVADEPGDRIYLYDISSGDFLGQIADPNSLIQSPTHLLVNGGKLYITVSGSDKDEASDSQSSTDTPSVLCYDPTDPANPTLSTIISGVPNPSGITFDSAGNFYVACRTKGYVNQYSASFAPSPSNPFISGLKDCPEFLLWAPV